MKDFMILLFPVQTPYISGKILIHKLQAKMLLLNQMTRLFDHQYVWKELIDILDFFNCRKIMTETITFGWLLSRVSSHVQTWLDLQDCL